MQYSQVTACSIRFKLTALLEYLDVSSGVMQTAADPATKNYSKMTDSSQSTSLLNFICSCKNARTQAGLLRCFFF